MRLGKSTSAASWRIVGSPVYARHNINHASQASCASGRPKSIVHILPLIQNHSAFSSPPPPSPRAHLHVVGMLVNEPTEPALSFLFCSCVCFCLRVPFNCISFHKFSQQLSALSLCSPSLISALLVLSTIYFCMKVSLSPDIIFCG